MTIFYHMEMVIYKTLSSLLFYNFGYMAFGRSLEKVRMSCKGGIQAKSANGEKEDKKVVFRTCQGFGKLKNANYIIVMSISRKNNFNIYLLAFPGIFQEAKRGRVNAMLKIRPCKVSYHPPQCQSSGALSFTLNSILRYLENEKIVMYVCIKCLIF